MKHKKGLVVSVKKEGKKKQRARVCGGKMAEVSGFNFKNSVVLRSW